MCDFLFIYVFYNKVCKIIFKIKISLQREKNKRTEIKIHESLQSGPEAHKGSVENYS